MWSAFRAVHSTAAHTSTRCRLLANFGMRSPKRERHLANDEAQDVTIKTLTRGNPTTAAKFADFKNHSSPDKE